VNRSLPVLFAGRRSSPGDTLSRPCVRRVVDAIAFPLVSALGSVDSAVDCSTLFADFFATMAESESSRPCIIGYSSSLSRCGPNAVLWSVARPPGSRARSFCTCQVLRPRGAAWALAIACPSVLPSETRTSSAPRISLISRLDGWPMHPSADASRTPSRAAAHGSRSMRFATPSSSWNCTMYFLAGFLPH